MLHASHTELHGTASELALSRCAAGLLLVVYGAFLYFQMARPPSNPQTPRLTAAAATPCPCASLALPPPRRRRSA